MMDRQTEQQMDEVETQEGRQTDLNRLAQMVSPGAQTTASADRMINC
jgi:hypothetical protein